jgi:hypothetical protein
LNHPAAADGKSILCRKQDIDPSFFKISINPALVLTCISFNIKTAFNTTIDEGKNAPIPRFLMLKGIPNPILPCRNASGQKAACPENEKKSSGRPCFLQVPKTWDGQCFR